MPKYWVRGRIAVTEIIHRSRLIEALSPAQAREKFRDQMAKMNKGVLTSIESCDEEGKGGQVQDRLDGGGS